MAHRPLPEFDASQLEIQPLTPDRWDDLADLFGKSGAASGCWCMWWRLPNKAWQQTTSDQRRDAFHDLVCTGAAQGLLAYHNGKAVGWCSLGPRPVFARLDASRYWKQVDDRPVWSIVCFFIRTRYRGHQVATRLLEGAIDYARRMGVATLEAYARDVKAEQVNESYLYTGKSEMFAKFGFVEAARRHEKYPIMRLELTG